MRPSIFFCPLYALIVSAYDRHQAQMLVIEHIGKQGWFHVGPLSVIRLAPEEPQVLNLKEFAA